MALRTYTEDLIDNGYVGVLYANDQRCQFVLAHRGGSFLNLSSILSEYKIATGGYTTQLTALLFVTQKVVQLTKDNRYRLSTTGYSLGGWLAELMVYHCSEESKPWYYPGY